jgi:hypothetical protein
MGDMNATQSQYRAAEGLKAEGITVVRRTVTPDGIMKVFGRRGACELTTYIGRRGGCNTVLDNPSDLRDPVVLASLIEAAFESGATYES